MIETRTCKKCNAEKALTEFHKGSANGYHSWCKPCSISNRVSRYKKNRTQELARNKKWVQDRRLLFRSKKEGQPCMDCRGVFHWAAMQWDHRPDEIKSFTISTSLNTYSVERLELEIAKCDLVCANCHAVRTWERRSNGTE